MESKTRPRYILVLRIKPLKARLSLPALTNQSTIQVPAIVL